MPLFQTLWCGCYATLFPWQRMTQFFGTPSEIDVYPLGYVHTKLYTFGQFCPNIMKIGCYLPRYLFYIGATGSPGASGARGAPGSPGPPGLPGTGKLGKYSQNCIQHIDTWVCYLTKIQNQMYQMHEFWLCIFYV